MNKEKRDVVNEVEVRRLKTGGVSEVFDLGKKDQEE